MWNKIDLLLPDAVELDGRQVSPAAAAGDDVAAEEPVDDDKDATAVGGEVQSLLLERLEKQFELLTEGSRVRPDRVLVSTKSGLGIQKLSRAVRDLPPFDLFLPRVGNSVPRVSVRSPTPLGAGLTPPYGAFRTLRLTRENPSSTEESAEA